MAYQTSAFDTWDLEDPTKRVITQPEEFERLMNFLETRRCLVLIMRQTDLSGTRGNGRLGSLLGHGTTRIGSGRLMSHSDIERESISSA